MKAKLSTFESNSFMTCKDRATTQLVIGSILPGISRKLQPEVPPFHPKACLFGANFKSPHQLQVVPTVVTSSKKPVCASLKASSAPLPNRWLLRRCREDGTDSKLCCSPAKPARQVRAYCACPSSFSASHCLAIASQNEHDDHCHKQCRLVLPILESQLLQ